LRVENASPCSNRGGAKRGLGFFAASSETF
jgi:hypothetical protein